MKNTYIYLFLFLIFCCAKSIAQEEYTLEFDEIKTAWSIPLRLQEFPAKQQIFENKINPIVVEDTVYLFMHYKDRGLDRPSRGYCGYQVKKINRHTGETYWTHTDYSLEEYQRKQLSSVQLLQDRIKLSIFSEAEKNNATEWKHAYPSTVILDRTTGDITERVDVDKTDTLAVIIRPPVENPTNRGHRLLPTPDGYRYLRCIFTIRQFHTKDLDKQGRLTDERRVPYSAHLRYKNMRMYEIGDSLRATVGSIASTDYSEYGVMYALYDSEFNPVLEIDLANHIEGPVSNLVNMGQYGNYFLFHSSYWNRVDTTLRLDYHLFDLQGTLIDKVSHTLTAENDLGTYLSIYPVMDEKKERILLLKVIKRDNNAQAYLNIFASQENKSKLIKTFHVSDTLECLRIEYGIAMPDGDLMLFIGKFIGKFGEESWIESPSKYGWIVIDGDDLESGSVVTDVSDTRLTVYPNPTSGILHLDGEPADVHVHTTDGKLVYRTSTEQGRIDIRHLPQASYILKLHTPSGIENHKIIKL